MKRLLLAGALALLAHGIFFGIRLTERQKPSFMRPVPEELSMSLDYVKSAPAARQEPEVQSPPRPRETVRSLPREIREEPENKTPAVVHDTPVTAKNAVPELESSGDVSFAPDRPQDGGGGPAGADDAGGRAEGQGQMGDPHAAGGQGTRSRTEGAQVVVRKAVPLYEHNPSPPYPPRAKRLGMEGTVILRVRVGESGEALEVELEKGSGFALLDDAALAAVKKWQFAPGRENDRAVAMWVQVPVRFELRK